MLRLVQNCCGKLRSQTLSRALWVLILVVHVPALLATWRLLIESGAASPRLSSFIGLNLSTLFFLLKIRDVRFLRFATDPRSLLVIAVALTLMHTQVIGGQLNAISISEDGSVVGSVLLAMALTHVQRALRSLSIHGSANLKNAWAPRRPAHVRICVPPGWLLSARLCTPRPPPSLRNLR